MKRLIGIALLAAGAAAQAANWTPIVTGPDQDPTGLYVDRDSLAGKFPVRTIREKFVNSYREVRVSLVEMNCARRTWRTLTFMVRSPNGKVLQSGKSPNAKEDPIALHSPQESVRQLVCKVAKAKPTVRHRTHRG